jgi:glycosyltransferase involved in cell wall biosynthesis
VAAVRRLDEDPELRRRLAEVGRKRAVQRFGWNDHVDRLIGTFEAVARGEAPDTLDWAET